MSEEDTYNILYNKLKEFISINQTRYHLGGHISIHNDGSHNTVALTTYKVSINRCLNSPWRTALHSTHNFRSSLMWWNTIVEESVQLSVADH